MTSKTVSIISSVITVVLLILLTLFTNLMSIVMLNGFSGSSAGPALTTSLVCQGVGVILAAILTGWLARRLIDRNKMNKFLSAFLAVMAGLALGIIVSFLSFLLSLFIAGMIWDSR